MLTTEYLMRRIDQVVRDAFYEGADIALRIGAVDIDVFNHSETHLNMIRLDTEIIMSEGVE